MRHLDDNQRHDGTLRWGGLAGMSGSILLLLVFGIVAAFVGMDPVGPEASVTRFPDIRAARTVENSLYLVVLVLWVMHFLALGAALRTASPAPARFGSVLSILGVVVLAAGALPHVATAPIADRYHAPGTTPQDQATLVLIWQATQGIFDALLATGLVIVPMGLIGLGAAMLGAPAFGRRMGWTTVALGAVGLAAAAALLVGVSPLGVLGVLALIVFHLVLGWKVRSLGPRQLDDHGPVVGGGAADDPAGAGAEGAGDAGGQDVVELDQPAPGPGRTVAEGAAADQRPPATA
jgi:Domain of unknown function (DUF4386)